jgi:PLP dependent protein
MAQDTLAERLATVEARIAAACSAASRPRGDVTLIAVSKGHPATALSDAYALGLREFGENYAQELEAKAEELQHLADLRFHFIGHLQSNKARIIVRYAHCVHTVDSASLARELGKRARAANVVLPVLVEVNVGAEPQKHGALSSELEPLLDAISAEAGLCLQGLMTVPPDDDARTREAFDALRLLRALHGGPHRLPWLSMGMSDDLDIAIANGATHVRVGTALFGPRAEKF